MRFLVSLIVFVSAPLAAQDVQKVLQRDFHPRGQATMDRVVQDGLQRVCTESNDRPPAELAKQMEADQMKTIAFPQGSLIGDWKNGERIAQNGRGLQWTDKAGAPAGGSCYNCHQLSPQEASFQKSCTCCLSVCTRFCSDAPTVQKRATPDFDAQQRQ